MRQIGRGNQIRKGTSGVNKLVHMAYIIALRVRASIKLTSSDPVDGF